MEIVINIIKIYFAGLLLLMMDTKLLQGSEGFKAVLLRKRIKEFE